MSLLFQISCDSLFKNLSEISRFIKITNPRVWAALVGYMLFQASVRLISANKYQSTNWKHWLLQMNIWWKTNFWNKEHKLCLLCTLLMQSCKRSSVHKAKSSHVLNFKCQIFSPEELLLPNSVFSTSLGKGQTLPSPCIAVLSKGRFWPLVSGVHPPHPQPHGSTSHTG